MSELQNSWPKLTVFALIVGGFVGEQTSAGEKEPVYFNRLDRSTRERLDASARKANHETSILTRELDTSGDTSAFLISRLSLPENEETRRADEEHQRLLNRYTVQAAPADVQEVVQQLANALSENLKRGTSQFKAYLVDDSSRTTFTLGGGRIYLSREYFEELYADPKQDRSRLAFALGHEMGHICRGHVRRRYQSEWLVEQSDHIIDKKSDTRTVAVVNKLLVRGVDGTLRFLYSLDEDMQADLFALHLCRNAGIESEMILDPLRERMLAAGGGTLSAIDPDRSSPESRRLRAVLFELSGEVSGEEYGLLTFDPESQTFRKANDSSVPAEARAVVFLHGMESGPDNFLKLAAAVRPEGMQLLAFRYPNDGSLALAGKFLFRELQRVCPDVGHLDFVCHSAGGLVFRWYAELEAGPFHQAVLIGVPHGGSSLARLREFFDFVHFVKDFTFDDASLLEQILRDVEGQIGFDLSPGSLFLTYLNEHGNDTVRSRYTIIRGRALKRSYTILLRGSVKTAKLVLGSQIPKLEIEPELRGTLRESVAQLEVPPEISAGDLAVTLQSATLKGVKRTETIAASHGKLVATEETFAIVKELLAEK
jgi:pimeloyl-ACP methyl ester carboxylesterase